MPLTAAATRAALADEALNPDIAAGGGQRSVKLIVRVASGAGTFGPSDLRTLLRRAFGGVTSLKHPTAAVLTSQHSYQLYFLGREAAQRYGLYRANFVPNNLFLTDTSGWTNKELTGASQVTTGGDTIARSTAQKVLGPASLLVTTNGSAANEGCSMSAVSDALLFSRGLASASVRFGAMVRIDSGTGTVRPFIDEFQSDGTTFVARTTATAVTPTTTWQEVTSTRTCTAGNKIRVGVEKSGTVAESFFVGGVFAFEAAAGNTLPGGPTAETGGYFDMEFDLVFDGVHFSPEALYDAFDFVYGTVASSRDQLSHNVFELTLDA